MGQNSGGKNALINILNAMSNQLVAGSSLSLQLLSLSFSASREKVFMSKSQPVADFALLVCFISLVGTALAQNQTQATTDPIEARALNSLFQKWGLSAPQEWNISGELCSGAAVGLTPVIDDYNPFIKCNCTYNNGTTCQITALKVYALDIQGEIPDELWSLTYLTNLNLAQNFLTGNLSASIGNLIHLQYLTIGVNSLSGELPKELGLLTDLRSIALGSNNFSGPLPSELGSLTKLEQIYFDSSGVSGEIPSRFANLQNLRTLWGSDNEFTGRIPDFIGNWSKLTSIRFQGNSFEGPIPSSFSKLTSLTELIISDLSNGSSSLEFIKDMKALKILILRNDNIFGSIPSNFGEYKDLTLLDLSFNSITGQIPDLLFSSTSLFYLFLGSNRLNGTLPAQKNLSILNLDVSYNDLEGSLPPWVNQEDLKLNLVANNFTINPSNSREGLNCLQRGFPCYRGSPSYSQIAINCGGPRLTSSSGLVYERDDQVLRSAAYYVAESNRWAVSSVGFFVGKSVGNFTLNDRASTSSQITNSQDLELFQIARVSASSLRYYGLGLENGNYNVSLQFAETTIQNGNMTWRSLGRRVFDVYVQGNRVLVDFDIRKEAGEVSYRAVQKDVEAEVTENYLEIHLFWNGKGTCCIPAQGTYGPLISAIIVTPDLTANPPTNKRSVLLVGTVVGIGTVSFLLTFAVFIIFCRKRRRQSTYKDEELLLIDVRPYIFTYVELRAATEDFNPANKLGEGGFGTVFKGELDDGRLVAVKQLSVASSHGQSSFVTEIATISSVQHRNLVKLHGCCIEGDKRLLVYEYLENKSLDQALFGKNNLNLDWPTRYNICLGIARGLAYLHEESRLRIVHRDVKASNILLDSGLTPKISDFGLAKLYDDNKTHISTRVAGTIGYLAPEYAMRGRLTEKTDVFAFGVVALEIVSGRPNSDSSLEEEKIYLLAWAWQLHENKQEVELADPRLSEFSEEEMKRVIGVSLLCIQASAKLRPSMSRVVAMLSGDVEVGNVTSKPGYLTDLSFNNKSSFEVDNGTWGTDASYYHSSTGASIVADQSPSATIAIFRENNRDNR